MVADKSLAAEIEAVLMDNDVAGVTDLEACQLSVEVNVGAAARKIADRIAALQSRAFEDGARWMRDQAAEAAGTVHEWIPEECALEPIEAIWEEIRHLPLQPEGERNV